MTRFRDKFPVCNDIRPCFGQMHHSGMTFCKVLRTTYRGINSCRYCKRCITDRTDKPEPGYEPGEEPKI